MKRLLLAAALGVAALVATPASAAATVCARTPGSIYWEVCVARDDCLVYVWSTMPPAICANVLTA